MNCAFEIWRFAVTQVGQVVSGATNYNFQAHSAETGPTVMMTTKFHGAGEPSFQIPSSPDHSRPIMLSCPFGAVNGLSA